MFRPCFLLALAAPVFAAGALPPQIPVEKFFQKPVAAQVAFSPDGKYVAALQPYKRRMNLVVVDTEKLTKQLVTTVEQQDIAGFLWVNDRRLVFQMDNEGDEGYGLFAVNRDGSRPRTLAATALEQINKGSFNPKTHQILARIDSDPEHLLVVESEARALGGDVVRLDVRTGTQHVVARNPGDVHAWLPDRQGVVRIGVVERDGVITVLHRATDRSPWEKLVTFEEGGEGWTPLGFDGDGRTLFIASDVGRRTAAIYRYDTVEKRRGELVLADDTYDLGYASHLIYSRKRHQVVGLAYETDQPHVLWLEPSFAHLQEVVDHALSGTVNGLVELADSETQFVVRAHSDREPGVYYLLDQVNRKIRELAVVYPDLDPEQMAEMRPVSFSARDGLVLHGYLTVPRGVAARNLPLIVNPHGGPYGVRDEWGYNPEVQLLANRGYAVLQVNYRGSGGYGREFEQAGYRQWGLKMQDDISDGVKWAIAEGVADPARVVIYGASYGGYAAMAGLAFTPELYCAGINYVGVTDLILRGKMMALNPEMKRWHDLHIGRLPEDRRQLWDTSPVNFAERIRVPVLMGYGLNDARVAVEHGNEMASAMKKHGKPFDIVYEKDEGHGFRKEEHTIAWYRRLEAFLAQHVPIAPPVAAGR